MFNRELRKKLIVALRSGEYTQGFGWLKYYRPDGVLCHCAEGLLLEIAGDPGVFSASGGRAEDNDRTEGAFVYGESKRAAVPSAELLTGLALTYRDFMVKEEDDSDDIYRPSVTLISMNDGLKFTFPQIADALEATLTEDLTNAPA